MSKFADYSSSGEKSAPPLSAADGLVIRPGGSSDLIEIARIAAEREGESVEKWLAVFERKHDEADSGRSFLAVASLAGHIVGYGKVEYFAPPTGSPANAAPEGWYLGGVVVHSDHRRRGIGLQLTLARLDWIKKRSGKAYYFANERNRVSIDLHHAAGFVELTRDFDFPGVRFEGGVGILFVCDLDETRASGSGLERPPIVAGHRPG